MVHSVAINAVIIYIGTATIGSPIIEGLSAANPAYVVQGAVLVALLAVVVDRWFEWFEVWLRPGGARP